MNKIVEIAKKEVYIVELYLDYYVEVEHNTETGYIEYWMCRDGYGIKQSMYGKEQDEKSIKDEIYVMLETVDEYITHYREDNC